MSVITRPLILAGLLNVAMSASAADGYLPAVGPAPLRFVIPPPALAKPAYVLPPLVLPPVSVSASDPLPMPLPGINSLTAVTPPEPVLTAPVIMPGTLQPEPRQEAVPEIGSLTPQMFMQFFTGHLATNSPGVSVYTPVSFVPPAPALSPYSSSAFETTPPAKP